MPIAKLAIWQAKVAEGASTEEQRSSVVLTSFLETHFGACFMSTIQVFYGLAMTDVTVVGTLQLMTPMNKLDGVFRQTDIFCLVKKYLQKSLRE